MVIIRVIGRINADTMVGPVKSTHGRINLAFFHYFKAVISI